MQEQLIPGNMKKLIIILFIFISYIASATNYYIKTGGDDEAAGTSDGTAWATITKVNNVWAAGTFAPGDSILFNRDDTFYGTIDVRESGTSGNPITISAYGTGDDPVIIGLTTIPSWTAYNDTVDYYVIACESSTNNLVTVDGVNKPMGRWPDSGWMTYESHSGTTSITDDELTGSPDWTGAELVLRKSFWTLERLPITDHTNSTITYTSISDWGLADGYGYFIQNDVKTLNQFGEWCYDGDTLFVFSGAETITDYEIKITSLDALVTSGVTASTHYDYITIDGVSFDGSSLATIELTQSTNNWTIRNCNLNHAGKNCIDGFQLTNRNKILNNVIKNTNNNAIRFIYQGYSNVIRGNVIDSTGALMGMMYSDDDGGDCIVLKDEGSGTSTTDSVTYNWITNVGHTGIRVRYDNYYVAYNSIKNFAMIKNDAGGLYTFGVDNVIFKNNIILNGYGESGGCGTEPSFAPPDPYNVIVAGIYLDEISENITLEDNTTAMNRDGGMFIQMSKNLTVTGNTSFHNGYYQVALWSRALDNPYPVRNVAMNHNIFFARDTGRVLFPYMEVVGLFESYIDDIDEFGTFDYNYYTRPKQEADIIRTRANSQPWNGTARTLAEWQSYSSQDAHSTASLGTAITDTANIHFVYNDSTINKTITLSAPMDDVANTVYSGEFYLTPYTSLILLGEGTVTEGYPEDPEEIGYTTLTTEILNYNAVYAIVQGNVTDDGGGTVSSRGVCYALTASPTTSERVVKAGSGTGVFRVHIPIVAGVNFHIRTYAINESGTSYGSDQTVTALTGVIGTSGGKAGTINDKVIKF